MKNYAVLKNIKFLYIFSSFNRFCKQVVLNLFTLNAHFKFKRATKYSNRNEIYNCNTLVIQACSSLLICDKGRYFYHTVFFCLLNFTELTTIFR